jgi:RNA polymerase sigma-70 factor (ECF subfamily)
VNIVCLFVTDHLATAWAADRPYLLAIAARILADWVEAEDVVQDAFARLALQPVDAIDDVRAWLVVVVRRLSLDRLGSARVRLSTPTADVPAAADPDPADRVTLDDEVRRALGVVLDRLTPAERTSFVLHDVFGVPFGSVAAIVGRSPAACRQLASRARRSIRLGASVDLAEPAAAADRHALVVARRFAAAAAGGDLEALVRELDPDVAGWATIDGRRTGFARGVADVGPRVMAFLGPNSGCELAVLAIEDGAGLLASRRSDPVAVVHLHISGDRVISMDAVVLPR